MWEEESGGDLSAISSTTTTTTTSLYWSRREALAYLRTQIWTYVAKELQLTSPQILARHRRKCTPSPALIAPLSPPVALSRGRRRRRRRHVWGEVQSTSHEPRHWEKLTHHIWALGVSRGEGGSIYLSKCFVTALVSYPCFFCILEELYSLGKERITHLSLTLSLCVERKFLEKPLPLLLKSPLLASFQFPAPLPRER